MEPKQLYDEYPNDQFHMKDYMAYQERYVHQVRESDRVIMQIVEGEIARSPADRRLQLLDIGCSTGNLLRHLKHRFPALQLTGGDLSDVQLEVCRQDPDLKGITLIRADLRALPPERTYDVIVANAILYGFEDEDFRQCMSSVANALRPGGALIAFDFFHPWKQEIAIIEKSGSFPDGHPLHFRSYATVRDALKRAGFESVEFRPFAIPIDLPKPSLDSDRVESYTVSTAGGERLLFRGAIAQPWCHAVARRAVR